MATIRNITTDIKGTVNRLGSASPRRGDIDDRQLEFWVNQYRVSWIQSHARVVPGTANKRIYPELNPTLYQDLGCRILKCVDQSECASLPWGTYVSKVVLDTPPVEISGSLWVGLINKRTKFIETRPEELEGKLAAPYAKKFVFYWRTTGTSLYLATGDADLFNDLCYVNIREICDDPRKACYKKSLSVATCCFDPVHDNYPATGDMVEDIKLQILTKEFNIAMNFLRDFSDNNRDDRGSTQQPRR